MASPALVACASTATIPPAQPVADPSSVWQEGPEPSTEPSTTPSPSSPAPPTPTTVPLEAYLARIPAFDPAPSPVRVALSHYTNHAAFVYGIPTAQRVAFLTIDDGLVRHPMALELIRKAKIPVTLFLTTNYVSGNQGYFRALKETGHVAIEGHTISHPNLTQVGYADKRSQLCGSSDLLGQWYGERPTLFRPPFGEWDTSTLEAAWSCGLKAGFRLAGDGRRRDCVLPKVGPEDPRGRHHPDALPASIPGRLHRGAFGHQERRSHPGVTRGLRQPRARHPVAAPVTYAYGHADTRTHRAAGSIVLA